MFHRRPASMLVPNSRAEKAVHTPIFNGDIKDEEGKKTYNNFKTNVYKKWRSLYTQYIQTFFHWCRTTRASHDRNISNINECYRSLYHSPLQISFLEWAARIITRILQRVQSGYDGRTLITLTAIYLFTALFIVSAFYEMIHYYFFGNPRSVIESMPVRIQLLDYSFYKYDVMGDFPYTSRRYPNRHVDMIILTPILSNQQVNSSNGNTSTHDVDAILSDYGGLLFPFLNLTSIVSTAFNETSSLALLQHQNQYDKHGVRSPVTTTRRWTDDDFLPSSKAGSVISPSCRHPSWHKLQYPNCNNFHEMDISRRKDSHAGTGSYHTEYDTVLFSNGYYRDAWIVRHTEFNNVVANNNTKNQNQESSLVMDTSDDTPVILKTLRYSKHDVKEKTISQVRKDALIMERLSSSPRIVDIYGYCGTSMIVEYVEMEVEERIVPGTGYISSELQAKHDWYDIRPRNEFTVEAKLDIALTMAESLADLHGFKDGVIVHDDVQLCQWLRKKKTGQLKLGDFNRAGLMLWDERGGKYCKYSNGGCYGNVSLISLHVIYKHFITLK